jgi:transposase
VRNVRLWRGLVGVDRRIVIEDVEFGEEDDGAELVVVRVRARSSASRRCGRCHTKAPLYDRGEGSRRWRGLDLGTVQALDRSQPVLPMMPGMPERRTHDYARHGITSLFAAFNIADGTVITALHPQHRAVEFKKFLIAIDKAVPADLDVHLICDNLATHKTKTINEWLDKHRRFHMHFTPTYSSWINQVERWFALLTDKKLRRGTHRSIYALEKDIRDWIAAWNDNPKPFTWTKTADEILERLASYLQRIPDAGH